MARLRNIRTSRELRTLASSERLEIVQAMLGRPPQSVRELGDALGRLPVSLYYHLRTLEKAGLVVRAGCRPADKGEEMLYALPAREIRIDPDRRGPAEIAALRRIGASMFRRAQRLHDAMVGEEPAADRMRRASTLAQRTVKLDAKGLRRVNALLFELADLLQDVPPGDGAGAFYTITLHLARDDARK